MLMSVWHSGLHQQSPGVTHLSVLNLFGDIVVIDKEAAHIERQLFYRATW